MSIRRVSVCILIGERVEAVRKSPTVTFPSPHVSPANLAGHVEYKPGRWKNYLFHAASFIGKRNENVLFLASLFLFPIGTNFRLIRRGAATLPPTPVHEHAVRIKIDGGEGRD